ncbi:MAG: glycoside hydrolase family 25 protein [Bacteriovoracaceae bacterium]
MKSFFEAIFRGVKNFFSGKDENSDIPQRETPVYEEDEILADPTNLPLSFGSFGVDISHHKEVVDLKKLVNVASFIYLKATEGRTFVSSAYTRRAKELKEIGNTPWGAYHYYRISSDPITQAKHFLKFIDIESGLPPVLDIEKKGNENFKASKHTKDLLIFLKYIEEETGLTPIIYGGFYYLRDVVKTPNYPEFERYPLWLPWYQTTFERVKCPMPWKKIKIWQYAETGRVNGIQKPCDVNRVMS